MRQTTIDACKRHGCAWTLLKPWALSNKLCIWSVVRLGHPLGICEVSSRSPQVAERSEREKLSVADRLNCKSDLLAMFSSQHLWRESQGQLQRFSGFRLYTYLDSSVATSHCQWEKPKTAHTASNNRRSAKSRSSVLHKHLPRYKLSVWKPFQSLFKLWRAVFDFSDAYIFR